MFVFIRDLFKGVGNAYWDLGRVMAFIALLPVPVSALWNAIHGEAIDLMALGGGIAAVLTASAALIAAKDLARTNAVQAGVENA